LSVPELVDREAEGAELHALAASGKRKLALLYGRRRVGKTYLLANLWRDRPVFHFTASATSPEINRRVLIEEVARWSGEDLHPEDHPTWRTVFRTLFAQRPAEGIVIVLDEFQYLATDDAGLREVASELNAVWEGRLAREGGLLVVLAGSAVRTLEALSGGGSPLYGRLDWICQLHPFDYFDAARMVPAYTPADRIRAYAAFGGVPKYLDSIDVRRPLEANVVSLLLEPRGEVRLQLETVLAQEEGLREFATYQGILQAVGTKRRHRGEIAAALGREADTPLRRMVAQLVELGFLVEDRSYGEPGNQAVRFRIGDPALRFYYGMVLPNESAIAVSDAGTVWKERLRAQVFPTYVGKEVFEDVVGQAYRRHRDARGLPAPEVWGRWEGKDRDGRSIEIDVVCRLLDGRMLTGAAKFRNRPAGAPVLMEHLDALRRLADSGRSWAREALEPGAPLLFVSGGGFTDGFREVARSLDHPLIAWTLDDLFATG
jgi:uncharacterized protein